MRHLRVIAGVLLWLAPSLLLAQAQGRVKGTVTDTEGKPIADAKVILTCPAIPSYKKEMSTDKNGIFSTLIVDATKNYMFHIEAPGFQTIEQLNKPLIGGQTLELSFKLSSIKQLEEAAEPPGVRALREGRDLLDAGNKAGAQAKFEEAVKADPKLYLGWLQLAVLHLENGQAADALAAAEKCLAASPDFSSCLAAAANAAKAKGDMVLFDKYMEAYKKTNPSDPAVLYNEAVEYLNKNDDAKAKPLLEQTLQADENYPDALFQLGMIYVRAGDNAKAKELLQKFLQVAPNHKDAPTAKEMLKYL
ncbi:MAG: tetratricopeptide repeat protein [Acidobacteriota bacterium]